MEKFELNVEAFGQLSDDEFYNFCQSNELLRIERDAQQRIIIMAPTGSFSGNRNATLSADFVIWNRIYHRGYVFDSSAGFTLPNGAVRSPDVSFILKERWEALAQEEQEKFAPLCPDFVLELRSKNDRLSDLQAKMEEYVANGAQFGWLIDPYDQRVYVYDAHEEVEVFTDFKQPLRGRYFMKDFEITLSDVLA